MITILVNLGQLTRDKFRAITRKRDLTRNCSKLVEGRLFATTDLLLGVKSITLYFIWRVGGGGGGGCMIFTKISNLKKKVVRYYM